MPFVASSFSNPNNGFWNTRQFLLLSLLPYSSAGFLFPEVQRVREFVDQLYMMTVRDILLTLYISKVNWQLQKTSFLEESIMQIIGFLVAWWVGSSRFCKKPSQPFLCWVSRNHLWWLGDDICLFWFYLLRFLVYSICFDRDMVHPKIKLFTSVFMGYKRINIYLWSYQGVPQAACK